MPAGALGARSLGGPPPPCGRLTRHGGRTAARLLPSRAHRPADPLGLYLERGAWQAAASTARRGRPATLAGAVHLRYRRRCSPSGPDDTGTGELHRTAGDPAWRATGDRADRSRWASHPVGATGG